MFNNKQRQLDHCLQRIASGEIEFSDCAAQFPEIANDLRIAIMLSEAARLPVTTQTQRKVKAKVMQNLPDRDVPVTQSKGIRYTGQNMRRRMAMSWIIIVTTLISLITGGGVVYASGNALPGDILYPIKTWVEEVRLAVASNETDAGLHFQFAETRLAEIAALMEEGELDDVEEALGGYENQVQLMAQTMAKVNALDPEEAIRMRTDLQTKLQDQARLMEDWLADLGEEELPLQDRIREMLQSNTQLRERINEVNEEPIEGVEDPGEEETSTEPDMASETTLDSVEESAEIKGNIDSNANAFRFDLNGRGQNGVYALISGARYECTLDGDTAVCPAFGAPERGSVQLYDQQTHHLLFTYAYEYAFSFEYDHSWQGEKNDNGGTGEPGGSDSGERGGETNSNGK